MENKKALLERLQSILIFRALTLAPPGYWQIPVLKYLLEVEARIDELETLERPEAEHREAVALAFGEGLLDWLRELSDKDITDEEYEEEYAWWLWYGVTLGIINDDTRRKRIEIQAQQGIYKTYKDLEVAALLFDPPEIKIEQIPPGHIFWSILGVRDAGEWHKLDGITRCIRCQKTLTKQVRVFLRLLISKEAKKGMTGRLEYVSDFTGIEPSVDNKIDYLNNRDRLSQFYELAGIDMELLTDRESSRILDLLNALDVYDFASKQGFSMAAYYGDKADSEKTQRQRLFKKIRQASSKTR